MQRNSGDSDAVTHDHVWRALDQLADLVPGGVLVHPRLVHAAHGHVYQRAEAHGDAQRRRGRGLRGRGLRAAAVPSCRRLSVCARRRIPAVRLAGQPGAKGAVGRKRAHTANPMKLAVKTTPMTPVALSLRVSLFHARHGCFPGAAGGCSAEGSAWGVAGAALLASPPLSMVPPCLSRLSTAQGAPLASLSCRPSERATLPPH